MTSCIKSRKHQIGLSLLGVVLLILGCTPTSSEGTRSKTTDLTCPDPEDGFGFLPHEIEGEPPTGLAGTWKLKGWYKNGGINPFPFEDTLEFGANNLIGNDTCNEMGFYYDYTAPKGRLCNGYLTLMACGPTVEVVT